MAATPIYRSVMLEVERRRLQLGWPMWKVDEVSGVQDGYYAKMLYADSPSGRQARWDMLQYVVQALFPGGFDIKIGESTLPMLDPSGLKRKIRLTAGVYDRKSYRKIMSELGKNGGKARQALLTKTQRKALAKKAGMARWNKRKLKPQTEAGKPCQKDSQGQM